MKHINIVNKDKNKKLILKDEATGGVITFDEGFTHTCDFSRELVKQF